MSNPEHLYANEDQAEKGLLASIESRRSLRRTPSGDSWHSSVDGERPPLGNTGVAFDKIYSAINDTTKKDDDSASQASSERMKHVVRAVKLQSQASATGSATNSSQGSSMAEIAQKLRRQSHTRTTSMAHAILDIIQEDSAEDDNVDNASEQQHVFEGVGGGGDSSDLGHSQFSVEDTATDRLITGAMQVEQLFQDDDTASLTNSDVERSDTDSPETVPLNNCEINSSYGSLAARRIATRRRSTTKWRRMREKMCNPSYCFQTVWSLLCSSYFVTFGILAFLAAWFSFHFCGNPPMNFLPGTVSWWLNFVGRQSLTLDLARVLQYLVIDKVVLSLRVAVRFLGPLFTLFVIQSRGWPFILTTWGLIDLCFVTNIEHHWLFYSDADSQIIDQTAYLRVLWSIFLAGFLESAKRTFVAMYFGKRTFAEFKPRLEQILKDITLLAEVSELAQEAFADNAKYERDEVKLIGEVDWNDSRNKMVGERMVSEDLTDDEESDEETETDGFSSQNYLKTNISGSLRAKGFLDSWEEPKKKKTTNASIHDILKFRQALTFMDDAFPFSKAFGRASTRDEVIDSAHTVYYRLLSLNPERDSLSCEVIDLLALEDDGVTINMPKKKALRKLYRPDANQELSFLAFTQSCDSLYKRLRFFRASVGNASVIDHVLESIIDGIFHFVLALVLLSIMRFNPWPLLVSISTLLVSVSFAVGSSASKYIEGILLIAVRRPYDLGDRIYMKDPSISNVDYGYFASWFVEDISLFNTTVRYAGTNEVATVSNGSIANLRIVNGNRAPNAVVWFQLPFHISVLENDRIETLKKYLDKYAKDHPRDWHSFLYCRVDEYKVEQEKVVITMGFQHRSSWQDLGRILMSKSELIAFVYHTGKNLGIIYEELPKRDLLYYAGSLKDGGVKDYRRDLHQSENVMKQLEDCNESRPTTTDKSANSMFLANLRQSHA